MKWWRKRPRKPVGTPHRVEPTPTIIFSALLGSMHNAQTDKEIKQVVYALKSAYDELERHHKKAAALFIAELYEQQMARSFTRVGIDASSMAAVRLGLATPTE